MTSLCDYILYSYEGTSKLKKFDAIEPYPLLKLFLLITVFGLFLKTKLYC